MKKNFVILFCMIALGSAAQGVDRTRLRVPVRTIASGLGNALSNSNATVATLSTANSSSAGSNDLSTKNKVRNDSAVGNRTVVDLTGGSSVVESPSGSTMASGKAATTGSTGSTITDGAGGNASTLALTNNTNNLVGTQLSTSSATESVLGGTYETLGIASQTGSTVGTAGGILVNSGTVTNNGTALSQPIPTPLSNATIPTMTSTVGDTVLSHPVSSVNLAAQTVNVENTGSNNVRTRGSAAARARTDNTTDLRSLGSTGAVSLGNTNMQATGSAITGSVTGTTDTYAENTLITTNNATMYPAPTP